ncbi:snaclec salmorin subunit A-like [Mercenaria mercenaria]|uniref:snaclec salmorin subunit A-like n=1 Tax=Mercenaria mercenaria TaxID=6596 RepID=UPI00234F4076|nr:snaclec salmorin subunit A-like [Mercenaria mercenaria]
MSLKCVLFKCIAFGYFITFGARCCPVGYSWQSGGCYLAVGLNVSWIDARNYCKVLGGDLLSIESSATQRVTEIAVSQFSGKIFPGKFWLDFNDLLNPKDWKRMRDHHTLVFENLHLALESTEVEHAVHNCVYMDQDYRWLPEHCGKKMNFVCYTSGSVSIDTIQSSSMQRFKDHSEEGSVPDVTNNPKNRVVEIEKEEDLFYDPFGWYRK